MPSRRDPTWGTKSHRIKPGSTDEKVLAALQSGDMEWWTQADLRDALSIPDKHVVQSALYRLRHLHGYVIDRESIIDRVEAGKPAWRYRLNGRLTPLVDQARQRQEKPMEDAVKKDLSPEDVDLIQHYIEEISRDELSRITVTETSSLVDITDEVDALIAEQALSRLTVASLPRLGECVHVVGEYLHMDGTVELTLRNAAAEWKVTINS